MESYMEVPQKLKIELLYDPVIQLLGIYLKEWKSRSSRDVSTFCSLQYYTQQPNCANNLNVHQQMNRQRKCGIYMQ